LCLQAVITEHRPVAMESIGFHGAIAA